MLRTTPCDQQQQQQQQQEEEQQQNAGASEEKKEKQRELKSTRLEGELEFCCATERLDFRVTRQYVVDQHPFVIASADFDVDKSSGVAKGPGLTHSKIEANKRLIQLKKKICLKT